MLEAVELNPITGVKREQELCALPQAVHRFQGAGCPEAAKTSGQSIPVGFQVFD